MTKQLKNLKLMRQIEASKIIGVSRTTISLGIKSGRFKGYQKDGRILVDINQVKRAYKTTTRKHGSPSESKYLKNVNGKINNDIPSASKDPYEIFDIHDLRLQAERNKAMKEKIQLEATLGKYLEFDKVKKEFCSIADNLKKSILAIPDRVSPIIAAETDEHIVRQTLVIELKRSLQGTVDRKLKEYENEEISNNIS